MRWIRDNPLKAIGILIVLLVVLSLPPMRALLLFVLPLGLKPDDIVVWLILGIVIVSATVGWSWLFDAIERIREGK